MKVLKQIPLFGFILIIFNILILIGKGSIVDNSLFKIKMISGAEWFMKVADLFIILGLICLFVEVFKATRTSVASIYDHIFSTLIFIIFLVEFITVRGAGSSTFLSLSLMSLFDVVAGFTITITTARRDVTLDREASFIPPTH